MTIWSGQLVVALSVVNVRCRMTTGHPTSDDAARDANRDSESAAHQMVSPFNSSLPLVLTMNARLKWSRERRRKRRRGVTIMSDDHCHTVYDLLGVTYPLARQKSYCLIKDSLHRFGPQPASTVVPASTRHRSSPRKHDLILL